MPILHINEGMPVDVFVSKPVIALQAAFLQMLDDYEVHDPGNGGSKSHLPFPSFLPTIELRGADG